MLFLIRYSSDFDKFPFLSKCRLFRNSTYHDSTDKLGKEVKFRLIYNNECNTANHTANV